MLVARERDPLTIGRGDEGSLPHAPRRPTVLERLVDEGPAIEPQVQPTTVVAQAELGAVRHEPDLLHRSERLRVDPCGAPSNVTRSIRDVSHGMCGAFHACQATLAAVG